MKVIAVLPAYNAEKTLEKTIKDRHRHSLCRLLFAPWAVGTRVFQTLWSGSSQPTHGAS